MSVAPLTFRRAGACAVLLLLAATLGGCETTGTGAPGVQAAAAPPPAPMTHEKAATECWMGTERDYGKMSLDKRADIVSKCIDQKMGKAGAPAPKT
jgi:predicted small secreted protein